MILVAAGPGCAGRRVPTVSGMDNALGRFIRARRELIAPATVGLPEGTRRRTPGLRREELALLAGISIDYLVRLEQGRDQHPSAQVLEALGRVLALDDEALAHLHALAADRPARRRPRRRAEQVRPSLVRLVEGMTDQPAFITGRYLDVLAANALASALEPRVRARPQRGARDVPGDGGVRRLRRRRARARGHRGGAARERRHRPRRPAADRARRRAVLEEPRVPPPVGAPGRAQQDHGAQAVPQPARRRARRSATTRWRSAATDGQLLVVYSAEPGSRDEQALQLLAQLVHSDREDRAGGLVASKERVEPA